MENKAKKKSINTVIYLLLAAMFACVVFISIYTVASKKGKEKNPDTDLDYVSEKMPETVDTSAGELLPDETEAGAKTSPEQGDENAQAEVTEAGAGVGDGGPAGDIPTALTDSEESDKVSATRYFVLPVNGIPGKTFEVDIPVYSVTMNDYRAHTGVDISAPVGTQVVAASSGRIARIWSDPMMGRSVMIDHGDDICTIYQNLAEDLAEGLEVGAKIEMGAEIGRVGESALIEIAEEPHVHLEMKVDGKYVDPLGYISASGDIESYYSD